MTTLKTIVHKTLPDTYGVIINNQLFTASIPVMMNDTPLIQLHLIPTLYDDDKKNFIENYRIADIQFTVLP